MKHLFALALLLPATAAANPACGTYLTSNTTLTGDLDCTGSGGAALTLGQGVTLDGAGHTITSDYLWYALVVDDDQAAVANLDIVHTALHYGTTVQVYGTDASFDNVTIQSAQSSAILGRGHVTVRDTTISGSSIAVRADGGAWIERLTTTGVNTGVSSGSYDAFDVVVLDSDITTSAYGVYSRVAGGTLRVHDTRFTTDREGIAYSSPNNTPFAVTIDFARNDFSASPNSAISIQGLAGQGQVLDLGDSTFGSYERTALYIRNVSDLTIANFTAAGTVPRGTGVWISESTDIALVSPTLTDFQSAVLVSQSYAPTRYITIDDALICNAGQGVNAYTYQTPPVGDEPSHLLVQNSTFANGGGVIAQNDWRNSSVIDNRFNSVPTPIDDYTLQGLTTSNNTVSSSTACARGFDHQGAGTSLDTLIQGMIGDISASGVPGANGLIAKLNQIVGDVQTALAGYLAGTLTTADYITALQDALTKLDAFDQQLAAKIGNGQISAPTSTQLQSDSVAVRALLLDMIANA